MIVLIIVVVLSFACGYLYALWKMHKTHKMYKEVVGMYDNVKKIAKSQVEAAKTLKKWERQISVSHIKKLHELWVN